MATMTTDSGATMTDTTDTPGATNASSETLTRRDLEVLSLIAEGCSNPVIAEKLHMNARTVKTHVGRILHTLDASNRAQAVANAFIRDFLPLRWESEVVGPPS